MVLFQNSLGQYVSSQLLVTHTISQTSYGHVFGNASWVSSHHEVYQP